MADTLGVAVVVAAVIWITAVALLCIGPHSNRLATMVAVIGGAAAGSLLAHVVWPSRSVLMPTADAVTVAVLGTVLAIGRTRELAPVGALAWASWLMFGSVTSLWSLQFLVGLPLSPLTAILLWLAVALAAVTVPSAVVTTREGWEPLLRNTPGSATSEGPPTLGTASPRVSIHVPCYAEPSDLVIGTLNRLADLEYDNYEVLVIDNNTADPALWQPVQAHCASLGERFRFFHVDGVTGAKAGALNWALSHADPSADLIAVVDADYHVESAWLRETVGYFVDPDIGFVQAPHAYRDYEASRFATWANWEYTVFFQTGMVTLDRRGAGLTVGTMSLIRKQALLDAGGWAEWCLTEDSELSIRIHAAGYRSIYLTRAQGRGLVPDTFEGYRRQRFRWTYGPVQELRHHWRMFLPTPRGRRTNHLDRAQRLHHANHGIDVTGIGIRAVALLVGVAAIVSMIIHRESIQMPFELWIASTIALAGSWVMRLLVYRRIVGATLAQTIGGVIAFAGLSMVISIASLRATVGLSSAWHRTNKFRSNSNWIDALAAASLELVCAALCLTMAAYVFVAAPRHAGLAVMLGIALTAKALTYLCAPLLAIVANHDLRSAGRTRGIHKASVFGRGPTTADMPRHEPAAARSGAPGHVVGQP